MTATSRSRKPLWIIGGILLFAVAAGGTWALLNHHVPQTNSDENTNSSGNNGNNTPPARTAAVCVADLPVSVKIGQKLMFAGYNDQLANQADTFASAYIGGVIIMNETPATTIAQFKNAFSIAPIIGVDQEGGTVQRYTDNGLLTGATLMASTKTPQQAYNDYLSDSAYLKSIGITTNFAPVLGVISASPNALPGRMYSADPNVVTTYATQAINASATAGVTPVVKHFPGLGSTSQDTDQGSATLAPLATLETRDIIPYKNVASLKPDAMVSNAIVPDLTNGQPASLSPEAVSLLRSYGYQNSVIYTDSLTAAAIPGEVSDAVITAWQAGIDIAMIVQDDEGTVVFTQDLAVILNAATNAISSGQIDSQALNDSVLRIFTRKGIDPCSVSV